MNKKLKIIVITVVLAVTGLGVASFITKQPSSLYTQIESSNSGKVISYNGKDGVTALKLLEEKADTKTNGSGKNAFVTSINGVTANPKNQYWMFKINGETAKIGAGDYTTNKDDKITWELTSF